MARAWFPGMRGKKRGDPQAAPLSLRGRFSARHLPETRNSGCGTATSCGRLLNAGNSGLSNHSRVNSPGSIRLRSRARSPRTRASHSNRRRGPRADAKGLERSRCPACQSPAQPGLHELVLTRSELQRQCSCFVLTQVWSSLRRFQLGRIGGPRCLADVLLDPPVELRGD